MEPITKLSRRGDEGGVSQDVVDKLLIVFAVLLLVAALCVAFLFFVQKRRQTQKKSELPLYSEVDDGNLVPRRSHHRRVSGITISANAPFPQRNSKTTFVETEKQEFMEKTLSPPTSPVPQIRVTFPEEVDPAGKRQSGRSVVVHIGEHGNTGMEPVDESLPPYSSSDRFVSLDMERIGGLKEKQLPQESRPT